MKNILVSYFSASGVTKNVAKKLSEAVDGDLFEIEPVGIYTSEDLDWTNKQSRTSIEMNDKASRPAIKNKVSNIDKYDIVIIGFPVWWYTAPTIINTFIEENNLLGKDVYVFVTSGGSSSEKSINDLRNTYPDIKLISSKRFNGNESNEEYKTWIL